METRHFSLALELHLVSAFTLATALKPALEKSTLRGGGSVINTVSMSAFRAVPIVPGYGAAKAGLVQMTLNMGTAWALDNVRVNAVAPGLIESNLTSAMKLKGMEAVEKAELDRVPMARWGTPEDVAPAYLFLASEEAASSPAIRSAWTAASWRNSPRFAFPTKRSVLGYVRIPAPKNTKPPPRTCERAKREPGSQSYSRYRRPRPIHRTRRDLERRRPDRARRGGCLCRRPRLSQRIQRLTAVAAAFSKTGPAVASEVAERLGLQGVACEGTHPGGNTPQYLMNRACNDIASGELETALICGGEATRSMQAADPNADFFSAGFKKDADEREPDPLVGISPEAMLSAQEIEARLWMPRTSTPDGSALQHEAAGAFRSNANTSRNS